MNEEERLELELLRDGVTIANAYIAELEKAHKRLTSEIERLRSAIKSAQDEILFMSTWVEGDSYEAQVDMRKRCYEAVKGIMLSADNN